MKASLIHTHDTVNTTRFNASLVCDAYPACHYTSHSHGVWLHVPRDIMRVHRDRIIALLSRVD